jgi:DNA primase
MDAVEDIKQRLSIEDVVAQYVQLKRAGRNWKGLSPFTNERSPSFIVSPEKQIWHDFSSGRGGDMFSFVMEVEGLDFKAALELLARQAGVDLEQYQKKGDSGRAKQKERLYQLLDLAAKFYQVHFSRHHPALEYILKKRQFTKQTALTWRIGYSPEDGAALVKYAQQKGFSQKELKDAGLSTQRYRGPSDMFRGRIMIPLADQQGRVIGFTARLLKDNPNAPKYINTPQTVLYDKSRHVFGLHLAKDAIRKNKFAVIAEGNMDVIASHQAAVAQVVATAGTALTEYQLKTLSRFGPDVRLCFDADRAGIAATERAIPLASKAGVSLSVITIPSGKDPDELIRHDPTSWRQVINQPQYALDWLIERYKNQLDITGAQGKRQFSDIILNVVRALEDPVEREHYIGQIAKIIDVSTATLQAKLQSTNAPQQKSRLKKTNARPVDVHLAEEIKVQNCLLALILFNPSLRPKLTNFSASMFLEDPAKKMHQFLLDNPDFDPRNPTEEWREISDYGKILALSYEEFYQQTDDSEIGYEFERQQSRLITRYVKRQKQRIADELGRANPERAQELMAADARLNALLKKYTSKD